LTAGQAGDNPQLIPLIDQYSATWRRTPRPTIHLLADKAYTHPSTRTALRARRISHTIPERSDQQQRRKAKGSAGGRPPAFNAELYAQRNTIERCIGRFKQWRAIACRYDKYAIVYRGALTLIAALMHVPTELRDTP
jgi:transposase